MIVYAISGRDDRLIKIGICKNLKKRLIGLQGGNPYKLKVIRQFIAEDAQRLEKVFHDLFSDFHVKGEWFKINAAGRRWIKSLKNENGQITDCQYYYHANDLSRHSLGEKIL